MTKLASLYLPNGKLYVASVPLKHVAGGPTEQIVSAMQVHGEVCKHVFPSHQITRVLSARQRVHHGWPTGP